jgi:hypothetical protein
MNQELVLEFHTWRWGRPDDDNERIALYCFSLMPVNWRQAGDDLSHEDVFWTEVKLPRLIARQPGWAQLSKEDMARAMFQHAVEQIVQAGRKLREAPIIWTPTSKLRNGPPWDLSAIQFPEAPPVTFTARESPDSPRFLARKAAGL